ncbi:MAG: hypothetical protein IJT23_11565 [Clostridia bacterium]|nr:hypothetical protein [Clostridia bacterium]
MNKIIYAIAVSLIICAIFSNTTYGHGITLVYPPISSERVIDAKPQLKLKSVEIIKRILEK